jgi:hypothetical protein
MTAGTLAAVSPVLTVGALMCERPEVTRPTLLQVSPALSLSLSAPSRTVPAPAA